MRLRPMRACRGWWVLVFTLAAAGCSSTSDAGATGGLSSDPVAVTAVAEPTADLSASVVPTAIAEVEPASQSASEAERDGVAPAVAGLTFGQRVDIQGEVKAGEQRWVISRIPAETLDDIGYGFFVDAGIDPSSGELLHLDGDHIQRAVSMPSAPPTWILADGNLVFAGRQGDGAYPSSSIVRVDITTGDATRLWFPNSYANRGWDGDDVWQFVAPTSKAKIWPALTAAIQAQGDTDPSVVAVAVENLDVAVDQVETYDPTSIPRPAGGDLQCGIAAYSGLLFDFGQLCVAQQPDDTGTNPTVMVGNARLAGRLVGAGRLEPAGPLLAAIVVPADAGSASDPLVFVEIENPDTWIETGIAGRDEGSEIQLVSFFNGGFVGTWAVNQSSRVAAFDSQAQPIADFASPTDRELGYPPDPAVSFAAITADGQRLAFIERNWPQDGSGVPGTSAHLVLADPITGNELSRAAFELPTTDYVNGVDFDGRWALISVIRHGEAEPETPPPFRSWSTPRPA